MAEQRKKTLSLCVKGGATFNGTLEIFPASEWGMDDGTYRIRQGRSFVGATHSDKTFFTPEGVAAHVQEVLFGDRFESSPLPQCAPQCPKGTRVSVPLENGMYEGTFCDTSPFLHFDGRYMIFVTLMGQGQVMVPFADIIIRESRHAKG